MLARDCHRLEGMGWTQMKTATNWNLCLRWLLRNTYHFCVNQDIPVCEPVNSILSRSGVPNFFMVEDHFYIILVWLRTTIIFFLYLTKIFFQSHGRVNQSLLSAVSFTINLLFHFSYIRSIYWTEVLPCVFISWNFSQL